MEALFADLLASTEIGATTDVDSWPKAVGKTNAHIHLPPNFSAFDSVEQAVGMGADEGVAVLGSSNYYDYSVYRAFAGACRQHAIFPLFGLETIVLEPGLERNGIRVNDPKNPGRMYLCGKALAHFLDLPAGPANTVGDIRASDEKRMRAMVEKLNAHFAARDVDVRISYDGIVDSLIARHGAPRETIVLQERHVAMGCQRELWARVAEPDRPAVLRRLFGAEPTDAADPVQAQGDLRSHLMKAGKPAFVEEGFINFDDAMGLVLGLGGIPCYPILADGASPICEFEADPDALADELVRRGIHMAELIPIRNKHDVATRYARAVRRRGIVLAAGTEHNTLDLIPVVPACVGPTPLGDELEAIFWEGACVVAAHQVLRAAGRAGYVDADGEPDGDYPDHEARIRHLRALGEAAIEHFREDAS